MVKLHWKNGKTCLSLKCFSLFSIGLVIVLLYVIPFFTVHLAQIRFALLILFSTIDNHNIVYFAGSDPFTSHSIFHCLCVCLVFGYKHQTVHENRINIRKKEIKDFVCNFNIYNFWYDLKDTKLYPNTKWITVSSTAI